MNLGFEGPRAIARTLIKEGETRFVALSWSEAAPPTHLRRGLPAPGLDRAPLAALAGPRPLPRPPVARVPRAFRADAQGPHLRADRRDRRRGDDLAARDAGRRAQLGLPLQLDPRLDVRAVGPRTRSASTGRRTTSSTSSPTSPSATATSRSCTASDGERDARRADPRPPRGYDGARPVRIGNGAYDQRQHDVWGAVLDSVYLHTKSRDRLDERIWPILVRQVEAALEHWREPDRGIWEVRGEPKHFTSSKVMCWVAADRGARLARLRDEHELAEQLAGGGRRDPRRHLRERRRRARRLHPALRHRGARRIAAAHAARALPAADDERIRRDGARDRRRADRSTAWSCATGPRRPTTACRARRARSRSARSGWSRRWSRSASIERAHRLCEKLLSFASPLGPVRARRSIPHSGRHLGNFPQAFTHLALINAVMHVIHAEQSSAHVTPLAPRTDAAADGASEDADVGEPAAAEPATGESGIREERWPAKGR